MIGSVQINSDICKLNTLKNLEKLNSSHFKGKGHFEEDGTQNYLVFQPIYRYFRKIIIVGSGNNIYFWKSIGLSDEKFNSNIASNYKIMQELSFYGTKTRIKFNGSCLRQDKVTYNHGKIVNIYILYEITKSYNLSNTYPALENCLFGAVSLTKNADINQKNILDMVLDLIQKGSFHLVVEDLVETV